MTANKNPMSIFKSDGEVVIANSFQEAEAKAKAKAKAEAEAKAKAEAEAKAKEDKPKAVESPERFSAEYDEATQTLTLHVKMHKEGAPKSKAGKSLSLNLFNRKVAGWTFSFNGYYKLEDQDQDNGDGFKLSIKK